MIIFHKIVIIFFVAEIHQTASFSMLQKKKLKSHVARLLKSIHYGLGAINLHLEGAVISVSTIY